MAFRRTSSIEMRTPAVLSAGLHVVALVAAIVNFDLFSHPPIEPEPVMVDFVKIDKHAAAPKIGVQDPQPKDAKIAEETTKAPPPKTFDPPHTAKDVVLPPFLPDLPEVRKDFAMYYDEIARLDSFVGQVLAELERQGIADNTIVIFMSDNGRPFPRARFRSSAGLSPSPGRSRFPKSAA